MNAKTPTSPVPPYPHPAGGWGSVKALGISLMRDGAPLATASALRKQNKPGGFACVGCAWAKPAKPHLAEFCENGAKATAWELTDKRATPEFFARHSLAELRGWSELELEGAGRLTEPLRYDADSDRYLPVSWDEAIAGIGRALAAQRAADPRATVFYASGRASLEASYMYQLLARLYGNNNLPDSSNMCHESTSVALPETIGVPVGTVRLDDFEQTDAIFFFGQNVGVSSPRMLHQLQEARQRGVPIVTFNPLKEVGLVHFANPQSPAQMLTPGETTISTQYLQVRNGGDLAALTGLCKWLIEADDIAQARGGARVLDAAFIAEHTQGFGAFAQAMRAADWSAIERGSGLPRDALERAAKTYAHATAVLGIYGMGLTQHREGVANVQMLSNLLLLRGNIGRPGAGICPVRGHSNVQGQRSVGITEKPELAPLDRLAELYAFEPPRERGRDTVATCEGVIDGSVRAFVGLGGNFLRAAPDSQRLAAAWAGLDLTVHVATRLNFTHVVPGRESYLLPCLGRIEIDQQAGGAQTVAVEDSTGCFHASDGVAEPAVPTLRSEAAIVAAIAQACLPPNPRVPWNDWVADYAKVRDAIEATWPDVFQGFNQRFRDPGGLPKPNAARERRWETDSGKAQFIVPPPTEHESDPSVLRLMTLRSDDQFNTSIYSLDDRFRNVWGTRRVLFMHPHDMRARGLAEGDMAHVTTVAHDGHRRELAGLRVVPYDLPRGSVGGYFPECNPLLPLQHHAHGSHVPAAKNIPVRVKSAVA
ncbi:FdhF/YdeP family oxidoreductase [Comamonas endophytica]|uniref:FdhF/YdeP family oxidoreductase n=1 Tax=Comamonas endophytica TaxID=2949090 RepID=A0ABY6GB12_9BURK|nr:MULTISPECIES: FdhF/YdeP family oxidoreductase [unclassified Acidovorax]MCD2511781.1 FdhF/YdeP family oxidoreductase [Acidovorax sp. D4N7]UYG51505.1 FdhF/YdeP family oxidoreductase [Acidovorax sp. 5MLIR]